MYIGNDLQIAHPSYKIIDDISSGFNGSTTSFALQVSGATPVPFPISTQQVMISVNGVVQEPDPNGSAGFKLLGSNIVFSSAPANGHAFFGVINAGADYVTAGSEFPDGSATAPSFTFQDDQDTGWFRSGSGAVGFSANGVNTIGFDGNGLTVTGDATFTGDSSKNMFWDKSDGALEFADDAKATFGTGSDLTLLHDGTNSFLTNATGYLKITGPTNTKVLTANFELLNAAENEYLIRAVENSYTALYYNGVKTFETLSAGIKVSGAEGANAEVFIDADEGDDDNDKWKFVAFNGEGALRFYNYASGGWEQNIGMLGNGAVELYHNNIKRLETTTSGISVENTSGDPKLLVTGSGHAELTLTTTSGSDHCSVNFGDSDDHDIGEIRYTNSSNSMSFDVNAATALTINSSQNATFAGNITGVTGTFFKSSGQAQVNIGSGSAGGALLALDGDSNGDVSGGDYAFLKHDSSGDLLIAADNPNNDGEIKFYTSDAATLALTLAGANATFAGSVSDSKGDLRKIPFDSNTGQTTLTTAMVGKVVSSNTGWTIPASTFVAGDAITLVNNNAATKTITATALTALYNGADGANVKASTLTLGVRSMATIWFEAHDHCYIQASALTVS
jgi:hypothetical protein